MPVPRTGAWTAQSRDLPVALTRRAQSRCAPPIKLETSNLPHLSKELRGAASLFDLYKVMDGEGSLSSAKSRLGCRRQVRSYFTLSWRRSPAPFDELKILREIHGPLRTCLSRHVGSLLRDKIPILQVHRQSTTPYCSLLCNNNPCSVPPLLPAVGL